MVGAAATEHRVLQRSAQAWQRFAGIQQLSVGAGQEVNIATHFAGDARERLYKIERGAFAGQQDARGTVQLEQRLIGCNRITIFNVPGHLHIIARQLSKYLFTGNNDRVGTCLFWQ